MTVSVATPVTVFQSTPSQRGRLCNADIFFTTCVFQSTPSQRGRRLLTVLKTVADTISIHALAKRATLTVYPCHFLKIYFNPRPRKEGDLKKHIASLRHGISIHALAKRATSSCPLDGHCVKISIHALAKRATLITLLTFQIINHFNPRPRKEGDRGCEVF